MPLHVIGTEPFPNTQLQAANAENQLLELLAELNAVTIRLRQAARKTANGPGECPGAEHAVLEIIARSGSITVPQIARERATSRQNIQILVDRLEGEGRVELGNNPAHRRSALVRLTPEGQSWLNKSGQGQKQLLADIEYSLSKLEIATTLSVLRKIHRLLGVETEKEEPAKIPATPVRIETRATPSPVLESIPAEEEFPVNLL